MNATATIRIECVDDREAERLRQAVAADDDPHCSSVREGRTLIARLQGNDLPSLLRAADDVLACLGVAEDVMKKP